MSSVILLIIFQFGVPYLVFDWALVKSTSPFDVGIRRQQLVGCEDVLLQVLLAMEEGHPKTFLVTHLVLSIVELNLVNSLIGTEVLSHS